MDYVDFTLEAKQGPPPAMRLAPEAVIEELRAAGFKTSLVEVGLPAQYVVKGAICRERVRGHRRSPHRRSRRSRGEAPLG